MSDENWGSNDTRTGAYVTSGVLLLLYGLVPIAWVIYSLVVTETPVGQFLEQLVNPMAEGQHVRALTPYEWAFAVALVVVGICALAQRPAARGGALLLSVMLLFLSIREGIGLLDADYRAAYEASSEGGWILATRVFGLVVAVVVLAAMLRATDRPARRTPSSTAFVLAGWAMLSAGAAKLTWTIYVLTQLGDVGDYLSELADPSDHSPLSMTSARIFYDNALTVALLTVGVLALAQRRVARGAALALMGVVLYVTGYTLVGVLGHPEFMPPFVDFSVISYWAAIIAPFAAALVVLPVMALAGGDDEEPPALDPAGFAPLPGYVGEQHTGSH